MDLGVIAVRYARALLKSATALKQDERVYREMTVLTRSYLEVPELRFTIDNPMLSASKKQDLLETACGADPSPLTAKFLSLVLSEGREHILQFMATSYITLYRKQKNIIQGKLTTATAPTPAVEQRMRQMVEARAHGTVEFNTEVDPSIIGGFILAYDTYRMDASVKTKLTAILTKLKK